MAHYERPQEIRPDVVIGMDYAIACGNDLSSVRNLKFWVYFSYSVYGFSHNLYFSFHQSAIEYVFFKNIISVGVIRKASLHVVNCIQNIL